MNPKMSQLRKKAMALPLLPGVYIMHDKSGKIIYIGKAKKLKNRVSQYFGSHTNHSLKVIKMVENVFITQIEVFGSGINYQKSVRATVGVVFCKNFIHVGV